MQEEIEIGDCSCCRPLKGEAAKYQTDIISTRSLWKEHVETNHALKQSPAVGHTYFVFLKQPVKCSLHTTRWLLYDSPKAFYDGYENEEEIEQAKFCYGQLTKIISYDDNGATVAFTILKTLTLKDILQTEIKELPGFLADFFIRSVNEDDYALRTIGKYFQLSVSHAQGDIGQFCIFTEHENTYTICLLGEWAFTEDWTFGGKYKLPETIIKLITTKN